MYKKLSELQNFTIKEFVKKYWSFWNNEEKKFYRSDDYKEGYTPKYTFTLATGETLDLSREQLGQVLLGCFEAKTTLKNSSFVVKTNGKTGMEIRYYINYDFKAPKTQESSNETSQSVQSSEPLQEPPKSSERESEVSVEKTPF